MGEIIEDMDKKIKLKTKILFFCWSKKDFFLYKP